MPQTSIFSTSWQGSLADLANIIHQIKRSRAFGRLTLRNTERLSVVHLYFRAGKLIHIVGNRGDARTILIGLQEWQRAFVRFDRITTTVDAVLSDDYEQLLSETLSRLHQRGLVAMPYLPDVPRVIESDLVAKADVKQLITPLEWRLLVEAVRRVSLAVAHLVGPQEAFNVLRDILDDCSSAFPAFASLKIAPSGYLQVMDRSPLDHMSRQELIEGFAALITTCQLFCAPIIGEREAHRIIIHALRDLGPALVNLGVFRIDNQLLSSRSL
ncbi:MAG TPA: hypothetical protein VFB12_23265 [Ktedonobacteraceae bacterium]|nr:hypothetical protein [Ktedonobacteraceae bacterium]